jgi:hypothetical protein
MLVSGIASKPPFIVHAVQIILFDQYASAIISPLLLLFKISNDGTFVSHYNDVNKHEVPGGPKSSTGEVIINEREVTNNAPKIGKTSFHIWMRKCEPHYISRYDYKVRVCSASS